MITNAAKAFLRRKFIIISAYINFRKRSQTTIHYTSRNKEKISPKLREAWKSRFVNKWNREHENRKKSNETKSWFFEKIIKIEKLIVRISHEKRRCKIINEMEPL